MKKNLLWLDDHRDPKNWIPFYPITNPDEIIWVKNYNEFANYILNNGLPYAISFDHDLNDEHQQDYLSDENFGKSDSLVVLNYDSYKEKTGYHCALWLTHYCRLNNEELPIWSVHSANPVGAKNIRKVLKTFLNGYANHRGG